MHHQFVLNKSRRALVAGTVLLSSMLSGCAGGVNVHQSGNVILISDSGFLSGDQAKISGTLTITDAGCVGLLDEQGNAFPAVWPRGTKVTASSPVVIEVPGLGAKRQGDRLSGAGGYYAVESRSALKEVADRCRWSGDVIGIYFT